MPKLRSRQEPVDQAWIDEPDHAIVIDMRELHLSRREYAKQQGQSHILLRQMLIRLGNQRILNDSERDKTGIRDDGTVRLSIARDRDPKVVWLKVAVEYHHAFGRGLEEREQE